MCIKKGPNRWRFKDIDACIRQIGGYGFDYRTTGRYVYGIARKET